MIVVAAAGTSVAGNATSPNLMSGNMFEVLSRPSLIEFGLTAATSLLNATIFVGNEIVAQDQEVSAANRYPIVPDDWILKAAGRAGAKIFITFRNRNAAAQNVWAILNITPLA